MPSLVPSTNPRSLRRRSTAIAIGVLMAFAVLEVGLQAVALILWASHRNPVQAASREQTVLCVGDSFTFGIGASRAERAYPAQTERLLAERGERVRVVSCGWPGQTSGMVLRRLGAQLERHHPDLVYVLVGANDRWDGTAEVLTTDVGEPSFVWTWRTGRLIQLIVYAFRQPGRDGSPLLGPWHDPRDGYSMHFHADGRLESNGAVSHWEIDGDDQVAVSADSMPPVLLQWHRAGDRLVVEAGPWRHELVAGPLPPAWRALAAGQAALAAGDAAAAREHFTLSLSDPALELRARAGLAVALASTDRVSADAHVAALERAYAERPDLPRVQALVGAWFGRGDRQRLIEFACAHLRRTGSGRGVIPTLPHLAPDAAQVAQLLDALRAALAVAPAPPAEERAEVWRALGQMSAAQPLEFARCMLAAADLDGRVSDLANALELGVDRAQFAAIVDQLATDPTHRRHLEGLVGALFADPAAEATQLMRHLQRIVSLCRARGAEPVLLDYPRSFPEVSAAVQRVSREAGVSALVLSVEFAAAKQAEPAVELFSSRMHCTDAGYALFARHVAADAATRLRR